MLPCAGINVNNADLSGKMRDVAEIVYVKRNSDRGEHAGDIENSCTYHVPLHLSNIDQI